MTPPAAEFVPDTSSREIAPGSLSMQSVSPALIDVRKSAGFARLSTGQRPGLSSLGPSGRGPLPPTGLPVIQY